MAAGSSRRVFEVFVARVPWTSSANEVREYFGQFGHVKKCFLPFEKETGFHKGFAWVGFSNEESLNNALQKETHILEGVKVYVKHNRTNFLRKWSENRIPDSN